MTDEKILELAQDKSLLSLEELRIVATCVAITERLDGRVAEMGVYKGGTANVIGYCTSQTVELYDTFEGLPEDDTLGTHKKGEFRASESEVRQFLEPENFSYYKGLLPFSIPHLARFKFIHMDLDTEMSTVYTLAKVCSMMVHYGMILIDDWNWPSCPGVTKAVKNIISPEAILQPSEHQALILF